MSTAGEPVLSLSRREPVPQRWQLRRQTLEFFEVQLGQGLDSPRAVGRELHTHDAMIAIVADPADQGRLVGAIDQTHGAVVLQQQVIGYFADGRTTKIVMTSHRKQQLVLGRREPCCTRLLLTPALEAAQSGPQRQEPGIRPVGQRHSSYDSIVTR